MEILEIAHQAELEKSQKQSIELAESLRLLQEDVNVKVSQNLNASVVHYLMMSNQHC